MNKLDFEKVKESQWDLKSIKPLQIAVFVMCGGGFLGRMAAEQPADFYIDIRCKKLPYPKREIYQAVKTLETLSEALILDPHKLPPMDCFHNCEIF